MHKTMTSLRDRFLKPSSVLQRQYEILRAYFVEELPAEAIAQRFDRSAGGVNNLVTQFRNQPDKAFFLPDPRGRSRVSVSAPDRKARILALRTRERLSAQQIADRLTQEGPPISATSVQRVLKEAGVPKLWRRTRTELERSQRTVAAAAADRRQLSLKPRTVHTQFGGLWLFAHDLACLPLDDLVAVLPGTERLPASCVLRALLALKLWGIARPAHVGAEMLDEGLALFAGLNVMPKRATLSEYSCRVDPRELPGFMDRWHTAVQDLNPQLAHSHSFDLDFHTIPYHGDEALTERHFVSRRSRRQRGVLAFLARDAQVPCFVYARSGVRKEEQNDAILHFVDRWQARTGRKPLELVFDSGLTTYANLARLNASGIGFLTLRRRTRRLLAALANVPQDEWRKVRLSNIGRRYRTPRILESKITLKDYPQPLRQIAITDLGHDKPTLLLTNQLKVPAALLIDRYARRMVIENTIADAVDFFHMDALSAAVPMKIDVDLQLTLMASALYRILGRRVGGGLQSAKARTIFRMLVRSTAVMKLTDQALTVRLNRRANNPRLLHAGYTEIQTPLPWLGNRKLQIEVL